MKKTKYWACALALALVIWPLAVPRAALRCYPTARFAVLAGGLVRDTLTQLVWQQDGSGARAGCAQGTTCTWAEAKAYCAGLVLGGFSGFRLPTAKELSSIVNFTMTGPVAIDQIAFPNTPGVAFWTSSPSAYFSSSAWYVDFASGYLDDYYGGVGNNYRVRCVR